MEAKAYLPAGRKVFYDYQYRPDILERHGVTEDEVVQDKTRSPPKRTRHSELTDAGAYAPASAQKVESTDVTAYVLTSRRMEDVPLADVTTFTRAWRMECPWIVVCKSVSMFTRCSVCASI